MTAMEFEEWKVYLQKEELMPSAFRLRHAQLLAATLQGPMRRKSGKPWTAADLLSKDPWAATADSRPQSGSQAARMRQLSARGRK